MPWLWLVLSIHWQLWYDQLRQCCGMRRGVDMKNCPFPSYHFAHGNQIWYSSLCCNADVLQPQVDNLRSTYGMKTVKTDLDLKTLPLNFGTGKINGKNQSDSRLFHLPSLCGVIQYDSGIWLTYPPILRPKNKWPGYQPKISMGSGCL